MNGTMQRANLAKRPRFVRSLARMAKLADAADLKSAGSNPMGVQVRYRQHLLLCQRLMRRRRQGKPLPYVVFFSFRSPSG